VSRKTPDFWFEVDIKDFPPDTITTYRLAQKGMIYPTFIDGRVKQGGWSEFTLALSSLRGGDSAAVLTVDLEDADAVWRQIGLDMGRSLYAKAFTRFMFLSRTGRVANLDPRVVHRGFLQKRPQARGKRKAQLTSTDATGSTWFSLNPEVLLQKFVLTQEWLDGAGIINSPTDILKTKIKVYLGEFSDSAKDHPIGVRPSTYIGDKVYTNVGTTPTGPRTIVEVPPPVLTSFTVVGTPGSQHYVAAAVAQFDNGLRTALSNVLTMDNGPDVLDGTNYTVRTYQAPPGWEAYYEAHLTGIYQVGRSSTDTYLDIGRHALNGDGLPDWTTGGLADGEYHDDQDSDDEKILPQIRTAIVVTEDGTPTTVTEDVLVGVWVVGLGWSEIHALFGPSREEQTESRRVQISFSDPEVTVPSSWVEMGPADDLVRLTVHYATGYLRSKAINGDVSFATNGCGWTDTGGTDGTPITEADEAFIAIYNELVLKNAGKGYRNGTFGPIEEYPDGVSVLNTDVIRAWHDTTINDLRPRGLQFQLVIEGTETLRWFDQQFMDTFFAQPGPMDTGQIGVWSLAQFTALDKLGLSRYRYKIEIPGGLPDVEDSQGEVENLLRVKFAYNPDLQEFESKLRTFKDDDSIKMYGQRLIAPEGEAAEARCTRDPATIDYAYGWRLYFNKIEPVYQWVPTDLIGAEQQMGTVFCLSHPDGPYVDEAFFLDRKTLRANLPNPGYSLRGRSLERTVLDITESSILGLGTTIPFTVGVSI